MIASHNLDDAAAAPIEAAATYSVNQTRELHYDRALADGLPIATGVIESACRYLVQDRMGRTSARGSLQGAEAVLRLRAARQRRLRRLLAVPRREGVRPQSQVTLRRW
jgi:hypothetical protein